MTSPAPDIRRVARVAVVVGFTAILFVSLFPHLPSLAKKNLAQQKLFRVKYRAAHLLRSPTVPGVTKLFKQEILQIHGELMAFQSKTFAFEISEAVGIVVAVALFASDIPFTATLRAAEQLAGGQALPCLPTTSPRLNDFCNKRTVLLEVIIFLLQRVSKKRITCKSQFFSTLSALVDIGPSILGFMEYLEYCESSTVRTSSWVLNVLSAASRLKAWALPQEIMFQIEFLKTLRFLYDRLSIFVEVLENLNDQLIGLEQNPHRTPVLLRSLMNLHEIFYIDDTVYATMANMPETWTEHDAVIYLDQDFMARLGRTEEAEGDAAHHTREEARVNAREEAGVNVLEEAGGTRWGMPHVIQNMQKGAA
ncbi:hypothetical protein FB45DRAFT_1089779, partial [Roridomyces roridus]